MPPRLHIHKGLRQGTLCCRNINTLADAQANLALDLDSLLLCCGKLKPSEYASVARRLSKLLGLPQSVQRNLEAADDFVQDVVKVGQAGLSLLKPPKLSSRCGWKLHGVKHEQQKQHAAHVILSGVPALSYCLLICPIYHNIHTCIRAQEGRSLLALWSATLIKQEHILPGSLKLKQPCLYKPDMSVVCVYVQIVAVRCGVDESAVAARIPSPHQQDTLRSNDHAAADSTSTSDEASTSTDSTTRAAVLCMPGLQLVRHYSPAEGAAYKEALDANNKRISVLHSVLPPLGLYPLVNSTTSSPSSTSSPILNVIPQPTTTEPTVQPARDASDYSSDEQLMQSVHQDSGCNDVLAEAYAAVEMMGGGFLQQLRYIKDNIQLDDTSVTHLLVGWVGWWVGFSRTVYFRLHAGVQDGHAGCMLVCTLGGRVTGHFVDIGC